MSTFNGAKCLCRQAEGSPEPCQEAVLGRLVGGPEPQHRVAVAHEVRHEDGVELRVVQGVWDRRAAVLARVVHPFQPVIREVLAKRGLGVGERKDEVVMTVQTTCT